jgi:hypothetical protein
VVCEDDLADNNHSRFIQEVEVSTTVCSSTASTDGARLTRRRNLYVAAIMVTVAGAVVLLYAIVVSRNNRAHELYDYGDVNQFGPLRVGATLLVGGDVQPRGYKSGHHTLELISVIPRITVNTARATVRVLECTLADPHLGIGMGPASEGKTICATLRQFHPGPVDLGFPATELIYAVTATRPGRLRVEGADVSYLDGVITGQQHAGSGFALRVTPPPG